MESNEIAKEVITMLRKNGKAGVAFLAVPIPKKDGWKIDTIFAADSALKSGAGISAIISIVDQALGLLEEFHPIPDSLRAKRKDIIAFLTGVEGGKN